MSVLLAIKDWDEVFEDRRSRAVDRLQFLACRVLDRKSEAYAILVALPGGVEAYGVFWALVLVAARCMPRGILSDDKGPLTAPRLAAKTRMPVDCIERAIVLLSRSDVGWLVSVDGAPSARRPRAVQIDESAVRAPSDPPSERRADGAKSLCAPSARATATQQQQNTTATTTATGDAAAAAVGFSGEEVQARAAYLRRRPDWLADGKPWISTAEAERLASSAIGPTDVDRAIRDAREARHLSNPAGVAIKSLRAAATANAATGRHAGGLDPASGAPGHSDAPYRIVVQANGTNGRSVGA